MRMPGSEPQRTSALELRELQKNKLYFLEHWGVEDRHKVTAAIKHGIIAELCVRDAREYGLPPDNRRGEYQTIHHEGRADDERFIANPDWARDGHWTQDWHFELDRRRLAFLALLPRGEFAAEWIELIQDDDGKDADGEWLCQKHSGNNNAGMTFAEEINAPPEADHRPKPRPDGGFGPIHDDSQWRRPKWLTNPPAEWCERPDATPTATVPETSEVPVPKLTRRQRASLGTARAGVTATP